MNVEIGDVIICKNVRATVSSILSQYSDDGYLACEFIDSNGNYRYWKQKYDGGKLIKASGK